MITVYVNLHPEYNYSNIIINGGKIPELKDYVANVDWLIWDYMSLKGKPMLMVHGKFKENGSHIKRTQIVLQRINFLISKWLCSEKLEVLMRNERDEDWAPYIIKNSFSEEEMLKEEFERIGYDQELDGCKKDIEKSKKYLSWAIELKDQKNIKVMQKILKENQERLNKIIHEEENRKIKIKYIFNE